MDAAINSSAADAVQQDNQRGLRFGRDVFQ